MVHQIDASTVQAMLETTYLVDCFINFKAAFAGYRIAVTEHVLLYSFMEQDQCSFDCVLILSLIHI